MSNGFSILSLLNLVESVDEIMTSAVARRIGKCEMSASPWHREIMDRIAELLKHASSEFAKYMNDCRPVNRIPPEILTLIFSFAGRGAPIIAASRVCKWWRQIAFSSPTLWSLYSDKLSRMDLALHRSKQALLDVKIRHLSSESLECLSPLRFQMNRLRTFDIGIYFVNPSECINLASYLAELFPSTAPHFIRFSLKDSDSGYSEHNRQWHLPKDVDSSCFAPLFGGDMPCLETLHLNGIAIWPQFSNSNLKTLVLINMRILVPTILRVLQNLPNLEVLALASLTFLGAPMKPGCTATMEHLRVLRVDADVRTDDQSIHLSHFLSSLSTQDGVAAGLRIDDRRESLFPPEIASENNFSINYMRKLYLSSTVLASNDRSFFTVGRPLCLGRSYSCTTITPDGILFDHFHCRLNHITHLTWYPPRNSSGRTVDLPTLLTSMPLLESLAVVEAFSVWSDDETTDSSPMFDALLEAESVTHIPRHALRLAKLSLQFTELRPASSKVRTLINLLSFRSASGYPVRQVTVEDDSFATESIQQMKEYVQDVLILDCIENPYETQIPKQLSKLEPNGIYPRYFSY